MIHHAFRRLALLAGLALAWPLASGCGEAATGAPSLPQADLNAAAPRPAKAAEPLTGAVSAQQDAAAALADTPSQVAMFRIADEDTELHLFGTIHILHPGISWERDAVLEAFDTAQAVYFEADVASPEAQQATGAMMFSLGMLPRGQKLSDLLSEQGREDLRAVADMLGVSPLSFEPMRPWFAGVTIGLAAIKADGGDPRLGLEIVLAERAKTRGIALRYFETGPEQIAMLASAPDEADLAMLEAGLADYRADPGSFGDLVTAWREGDLEGIARDLEASFAGQDAIAEAVLYKRNANWAEEIKRVMDEEPGRFFVAVGAGHLAGEQSLIDLLGEMGYRAERL